MGIREDRIWFSIEHNGSSKIDVMGNAPLVRDAHHKHYFTIIVSRIIISIGVIYSHFNVIQREIIEKDGQYDRDKDDNDENQD
jgi:hypothetical protein